MKDSEPLQRANAAALRLLAHRARSEAELRTRLLRRFPPEIIELVMKTLSIQGLVDDSSFADLWAANRDSLHPRSSAAIRRELVSKGVTRDVADEAVRDINDQDAAYRAGLKPANRLGQVGFSAFRRNLWGYLKRRGFGDSVTRHTIAVLWEERLEVSDRPRGSMNKSYLCQ